MRFGCLFAALFGWLRGNLLAAFPGGLNGNLVAAFRTLQIGGGGFGAIGGPG